jgi:hypothetical protein
MKRNLNQITNFKSEKTGLVTSKNVPIKIDKRLPPREISNDRQPKFGPG